MRRFFVILSFFLSIGALTAQQIDVDSLFLAKIAQEQLSDSTNKQKEIFLFVEGVRCRLDAKFDSALYYYRQCLELDATNPAIYSEVAQTYLFKGESDSARANMYKACEFSANDVLYVEALANYEIMYGQKQVALQLYSDLSKKDPTNQKYLYALGELYKENPKKQLEILRRIEKLEGVSPENSYRQMLILDELKRTKEAEKQLIKLVDNYPNTSAFQVLLGDYYLHINKPKKALQCYNKLLEADSLDGEALVALCKYYYSYYDFERGDAYMLRAIHDKRSPLDDKVTWLRAHIAGLKYDSAYQTIDSLLDVVSELYPEENQVLHLKAEYYQSCNDDVRAEKTLRQLVELYPMDEESWKQLLFLHDRVSDTTLEIVTQALNYFPTSPFWHFCHINALQVLSTPQVVLAAIDSALQYDMDPTILSALYGQKGDVLQHCGGADSLIIASYEHALYLSDKNTSGQNNYAYYLACRGENLSRAEKLSSAAVKAEPENATYLDTYAWVLFKRGDYRLARFYQERALALDTLGHAELLEHYGDILAQLGEVDLAIEQWQKALQIEPSTILRQKIEARQYIPETIKRKEDETEIK